jgi:hypothetical protein
VRWTSLFHEGFLFFTRCPQADKGNTSLSFGKGSAGPLRRKRQMPLVTVHPFRAKLAQL